MNIWVGFKGADYRDEECKPAGPTILMKWEMQLSDDRGRANLGGTGRLEVKV